MYDAGTWQDTDARLRVHTTEYGPRLPYVAIRSRIGNAVAPTAAPCSEYPTLRLEPNSGFRY